MLIILFKQGECLVSGRLEASLGDTMQFQSPNRIPDCFLLMSILGIVSAKIVSRAARLIASLPALGYTFVILTPLILKEIILPLSDHLRQLYSVCVCVCVCVLRVSKILHPTFILLSLLFSFIYPTVSSSVIHF